MTEAELDAIYNELHDATIKRLLGDVNFEVKEEVHTDVDNNYVTGPTMYDAPRVHKNMNPCMEPGYTLDIKLRDSYGYLTAKYEAPISEAAAQAK